MRLPHAAVTQHLAKKGGLYFLFISSETVGTCAPAETAFV